MTPILWACFVVAYCAIGYLVCLLTKTANPAAFVFWPVMILIVLVFFVCVGSGDLLHRAVFGFWKCPHTNSHGDRCVRPDGHEGKHRDEMGLETFFKGQRR